MNLTEIQQAVNSFMLGMELDPAELNVWIDAGQNKLAHAGALQKTFTVDVVDGGSYSLPADFLEPVAIDLDGAVQSVGVGSKYSGVTFWGRSLINRTGCSGALTLYYNAFPAKLTQSSQTSDMPEQFHMAIVYYATAQAKRKYTMLEDGQEFERLFNEDLKTLQRMIQNQEGADEIEVV